MDELILLLVIFAGVFSSINKAKKAKKTNSKSPEKRAEEIFEKISTFAEKFEGDGRFFPIPGLDPVRYEPMQFSELPREAQELAMEEWREHGEEPANQHWGSLDPSSLQEGEDTCSPDLGHLRERIAWTATDEPHTESAPAFTLSFESDALLQSIVMSEVLARPICRKWGRR